MERTRERSVTKSSNIESRDNQYCRISKHKICRRPVCKYMNVHKSNQPHTNSKIKAAEKVEKQFNQSKENSDTHISFLTKVWYYILG